MSALKEEKTTSTPDNVEDGREQLKAMFSKAEDSVGADAGFSEETNSAEEEIEELLEESPSPETEEIPEETPEEIPAEEKAPEALKIDPEKQYLVNGIPILGRDFPGQLMNNKMFTQRSQRDAATMTGINSKINEFASAMSNMDVLRSVLEKNGVDVNSLTNVKSSSFPKVEINDDMLDSEKAMAKTINAQSEALGRLENSNKANSAQVSNIQTQKMIDDNFREFSKIQSEHIPIAEGEQGFNVANGLLEYITNHPKLKLVHHDYNMGLAMRDIWRAAGMDKAVAKPVEFIKQYGDYEGMKGNIIKDYLKDKQADKDDAGQTSTGGSKATQPPKKTQKRPSTILDGVKLMRGKLGLSKVEENRGSRY